MKIVITGQQGLAAGLAEIYRDHDVTCVSRASGHDIQQVDQWVHQFLDHDMVFNCAYCGRGQAQVLEAFWQHWKDLEDRTIITIGSRVTYQPRSFLARDREYWPYRQHKQELQTMHDSMLAEARCNLKIINPGPFDTPMAQHITGAKMTVQALAQRIRDAASDPAVRRLDLWQ